MSTLDTAFIKAYSKPRAVEPLAPEPEVAPQPVVADAPVRRGLALSLADLYAESPRSTGRLANIEERPVLNKAHKRTPPTPHVKFGKPPARPSFDDQAPPAPRLASHTLVDPPHGLKPPTKKAPLSSFRLADDGLSDLGLAARLATQTPVDSTAVDPALAPSDTALDNEDLSHGVALVAAGEPGHALAANPHPRRAEAAQPAFQLERFNWPAVCTQLLTEAAVDFQEVCEQLIAQSRQGLRLCAVLGASPQAGATTVALCTARALAAHGLRVALLDAHLTHPQLADQLGVLPTLGWHDVLAADLPLAECWIESIIDRITLMPLGGPVTHDQRDLASRLHEQLRSEAQSFDLVLVDGGHLCDHDQATALLSALPSGVLYVADARGTAAAQPDLAQHDAPAHLRWRGLVENFALPAAAD